MRHVDASAHVRGAAPYVDDLPPPPGLLHAAVYGSPVAHGRIRSLDPSNALACDGVVAVLTADDIPGANQIGAIIQDEPLFAESEAHYVGQPLALVVAESPRQARRGAAAVVAAVDELPAIFDPREAASRGLLITPSRTLECGDVEAAWGDCDVVVEGRVDSGGQEHLYLETQATVALPLEGGRLRLLSATQGPTAVQRIAARVLGLPMNAVEVEVTRLGGAFGGKEDQATQWAALAALAAFKLGRPVKIALDRTEDMRLTGKRHPYSSDFVIGLRSDGTILAYQVTMHQNAGAAADLSPAILERSMFHATGSYHIPNVRVTALSCRTNLPPFTAMRGFGAPQAMFALECAITRAAEAMGVDRLSIQRRNLLAEGDPFPYGMRVSRSQARRAFTEVEERHRIAELRREIEDHNARYPLTKRGLAVMPVCFGISFTSSFLNQASALVHIYTDGSVSVSTAAVEMGQGVTTKIAGIVARTLGIDADRVRIEATNTTRVANTSPTAASSGADLNGRAAELACLSLVTRLKTVAAGQLDATTDRIAIENARVLLDGADAAIGWNELVWRSYTQRVSLSAQAHYATPGIWYDREQERGEPFAYHVFGAAVVTATVDCLRGIATVDRVGIVHDAGHSLNPAIDTGQIEGGVLQGIGWMTMEELLYEDGRLITDTLTTYKVPDLLATPHIDSVFLDDADNPAAVLSSKAIGEPPFMYAIGAYFAVVDAMRAFRPGLEALFHAPLTSERILMALYPPPLPTPEQVATAAESAVSD